MTGPDTFDWSHLEGLLEASASRKRHAILRFILDYPGQSDSPFVPQFLVDQGLQFDPYDSGLSPDYSNPQLLVALEQFIRSFGANYDGDPRIGFIQLGLLGLWGEWHTYRTGGCLPSIPEATQSLVSGWYAESFVTTQLQGRYPDPPIVNHGFGLKDDSYAYATLNENDLNSWFFWPRVTRAGYTDFWRHSVMSGEVFPAIQSKVFSGSFPNTGSDLEQDFDQCTETTHATYMILNYAFQSGYNGVDLTRAEAANDRLGYAFRVSGVMVSSFGNATVDISVEITQDGVAPFYYPLSLGLSCNGMNVMMKPGVDSIIAEGDTKEFVFNGVPASPSCLNAVTLVLSSTQAYAGTRIKFAQGSDGVVVLTIPAPDSNAPPPITSVPPTPPPTPPPPTPSPVPPSCGTTNFQGECTSTNQCVGMYSGAYDCKNSEGGVCFCGNNQVCGCISTSIPPTPPAPPSISPTPQAPSTPQTCGTPDFQGECTTTGQCQGMYSAAYDCKNSEGGVCFCGNNEVCGCL